MVHPPAARLRRGFLILPLAALASAVPTLLEGATPEDPTPSVEGDTVRVTGVIVDRATGEFLEGVSLRLTGPDGEETTGVTDAQGEFAFGPLEPGDYLLEAEYLGYADLETVVYPTGAADVELVLAMVPEPVELDPVVAATGPQLPSDLRRFHERTMRGFGQHLSPEDIERLDPFQATDALEQIPNLQVESGGGGRGQQNTLLFRGQCPPEVFVDGVRSEAGAYEVDEMVPAQDLYGVEVYGPSTAPAELSPRRPCGVVAIWTEPGGGPGHDFSFERSVVAFTVLGLFLALF